MNPKLNAAILGLLLLSQPLLATDPKNCGPIIAGAKVSVRIGGTLAKALRSYREGRTLPVSFTLPAGQSEVAESLTRALKELGVAAGQISSVNLPGAEGIQVHVDLKSNRDVRTLQTLATISGKLEATEVVSTATVATEPVWLADADKATLAQAESFLLERWKDLNLDERHQVLKFLREQVLPDLYFQDQPFSYLRDWQRSRHNAESLTLPYDAAFGFLWDLSNADKLGEYSVAVKQEGYKGDAAKFYSKSWRGTQAHEVRGLPTRLKAEVHERLLKYRGGQDLPLRVETQLYGSEEAEKTSREMDLIQQALARAGLANDSINTILLETHPPISKIRVTLKSPRDRDAFLKAFFSTPLMLGADFEDLGR